MIGWRRRREPRSVVDRLDVSADEVRAVVDWFVATSRAEAAGDPPVLSSVFAALGRGDRGVALVVALASLGVGALLDDDGGCGCGCPGRGPVDPAALSGALHDAYRLALSTIEADVDVG